MCWQRGNKKEGEEGLLTAKYHARCFMHVNERGTRLNTKKYITLIFAQMKHLYVRSETAGLNS